MARSMSLGMFAVLAGSVAPLPALALAQPATPYHWRNVTVGAGGYAPGIVSSPAERGLASLRTDMGGAYRWDAAVARWVPLQDGNVVSSHMGIESVAPDPRDPAIVYLAAGMHDDGHQWGLRFRVISGDPRVAGRVYLGTDGRGLFYGDPAGERK